MSQNEQTLKERIRELESDLQAKEAELAQMRLRLNATNTRLEEVIDRISHEIKMAGKIQKLLTPVEIPSITGIEFSTKFVPGLRSGGDYFDIFEHEDRMRFGVVLSAGSGYAMSALFLSILMKVSSKMEARRGMQAHELVQTVGREMQSEMKQDDRASLFYGIVDRRSFELSYCSVGDVSALIQVSGQEALQRLSPLAPALSSQGLHELQTQKVSLNPRDRLILATQGLSQALSPEGKTWGETGLQEAIRSAPRQGVHELRNEILLRCETFSKKSEPDRDQTLVVLEVKDKVIKLAQQ